MSNFVQDIDGSTDEDELSSRGIVSNSTFVKAFDEMSANTFPINMHHDIKADELSHSFVGSNFF